MEKYWVVDLEFVKADGKYVRTEHTLEGCYRRHFTYKMFSNYELNNYIGSEVISRTTEWDYLSESGEPYEYLEIIKRFIIPPEVVISRKLYVYQATDRNEVLEKVKLEYSIKHVVDENEMVLKPSEIIYYHEKVKRPYVYFGDDILHEVNDKTLILYDKKSEEYKYYMKLTNEEGVFRTNLSETRAKQRIESIFRNLFYPADTLVKNVEQVVI